MIVCKMYLRNRTEWSPGATPSYELGAVCRGEVNKDWAAATPAGTFKGARGPELDDIWQTVPLDEVLVSIIDDDAGDWLFVSCSFQYGGCAVSFTGKEGASLTLTVNAKPATKKLREAFMAALDGGEPARYSVVIKPVKAYDD